MIKIINMLEFINFREIVIVFTVDTLLTATLGGAITSIYKKIKKQEKLSIIEYSVSILICITIIVVFSSTYLSSNFNSSRELETFLKNDDYNTAKNLYQFVSETSKKDEDIENLHIVLEKEVQDIITSFDNQLINFDEAVLKLKKTGEITDGINTDAAIKEITNVRLSKERQYEGEKYLESNQLENAIISFNKSIEYYENESSEISLINCVDKYRIQILSELSLILGSDDDNKNSKAIELLDKALFVSPNDTILIEERENLVKEVIILESLQNNQDLINNANYVDAMTDIRNTMNTYNDDRLGKTLEKTENLYRQDILNKANESLINSGYESSVNIIKEGLLILNNDETLNKALLDYKEYAPIYMIDLPHLENTADKVYIDETFEDKFNNTYKSSYALSKGRVQYFIEGNYSSFKASLACPKNKEYDSFRTSATVTIYLDGKKRYTSPYIEVSSRPVIIDLDITGTEIIEFHWESQGANLWSDWGYLATLYDASFYK